jgi:hypothetical protein
MIATRWSTRVSPSITETFRLQTRPSRADLACFLLCSETPNFFGLERGTLWWSCVTRVMNANTRRNSPSSCPISRNNDQISRLNVIYRSCFLETRMHLSHFLRGTNFQIFKVEHDTSKRTTRIKTVKSQQRMDSAIEAGSWMRGRFPRWQRITASLFY